MTTRQGSTKARRRKPGATVAVPGGTTIHPAPVPILGEVGAPGGGDVPDLAPELRERMVSEATFHRYAERGFDESYEQDDRIEAETDVERELVEADKPARDEER